MSLRVSWRLKRRWELKAAATQHNCRINKKIIPGPMLIVHERLPMHLRGLKTSCAEMCPAGPMSNCTFGRLHSHFAFAAQQPAMNYSSHPFPPAVLRRHFVPQAPEKGDCAAICAIRHRAHHWQVAEGPCLTPHFSTGISSLTAGKAAAPYALTMHAQISH